MLEFQKTTNDFIDKFFFGVIYVHEQQISCISKKDQTNQWFHHCHLIFHFFMLSIENIFPWLYFPLITLFLQASSSHSKLII